MILPSLLISLLDPTDFCLCCYKNVLQYIYVVRPVVLSFRVACRGCCTFADLSCSNQELQHIGQQSFIAVSHTFQYHRISDQHCFEQCGYLLANWILHRVDHLVLFYCCDLQFFPFVGVQSIDCAHTVSLQARKFNVSLCQHK